MNVFTETVLLFALSIIFCTYTEAQDSLSKVSTRILEDSTFILQIHPARESYKLNIVVSEVTRENEFTDEFIIYDITIHSLKNDSLIQTFSDTAFVGEYSYEYWLTDINFDSYTDIALAQESGGSGYNTSYHFWVFNKSKNNYSLDDEFSFLSNPEVDTTSKTIFESNSGGNKDQSAVYIIKDNKLLCIEFNETNRTLDENDGKYYLIEKSYKLIDGEMKLVKEHKEEMR